MTKSIQLIKEFEAAFTEEVINYAQRIEGFDQQKELDLALDEFIESIHKLELIIGEKNGTN